MSVLVAGVDCSTQATKVVVCDAADGTVVASASRPHEVTGSAGARESDPAGWERALADALGETGRADEIAAVSIDGQQHGLVCLDGRGRPLRPAVLWNDTRSRAAASALRAELGGAKGWAARVGSAPVASFTVTTWAWLRQVEPDTTAATRAVRLPHDFLTERLTGHAVTDRGDVSGTGWWSVRAQDYDAEVLCLASVDLDRELLPDVLGPDDRAGAVTSAAARRFGLRPGTLVGVGTGDNMAAALGVATGLGRPVVSLGTSGAAMATSDLPAADPSGVVAGFADATGRWLPLTCTLNCTTAVDRFAAWLGRDRDATDEGGQVVVLPFLDGERTPDLPAATGRVSGLTHESTAGQLLRAVYEGAAFSLLDGVRRIAEVQAPDDPNGAITVLGGGAQGETWQRVLRRLSGRALAVLPGVEVAARGAAMQAAALATDRTVTAVQAAWPALPTTNLEPLPRDDDAWERIAAAREELVDAG